MGEAHLHCDGLWRGCEELGRAWRVLHRMHWDGLYFDCKVFLVKRGSSAGDSIFVGLPSEREARRVVHAATLRWPADQ